MALAILLTLILNTVILAILTTLVADRHDDPFKGTDLNDKENWLFADDKHPNPLSPEMYDKLNVEAKPVKKATKVKNGSAKQKT